MGTRRPANKGPWTAVGAAAITLAFFDALIAVHLPAFRGASFAWLALMCLLFAYGAPQWAGRCILAAAAFGALAYHYWPDGWHLTQLPAAFSSGLDSPDLHDPAAVLRDLGQFLASKP